MKEGFKFIGRNYEDEEKKSLETSLQQWSEEAATPIEGELEKGENEIKIIETINFLIREELESLEIKDYEPISLDKIHILPEKIFEEKFPNFKGSAFFMSTNDAVFINKDKSNTQARLVSSLLHELIHRTSTHKFYADKNDGAVSDARVGYRIRSPWKDSARENRLRGFNEVMTDYTVYKILLKNQTLLEKELGVTKDDIQGSIYTYMHYGSILSSIINKISENKNITQQEVFETLEKGQFQSSILALKDIEGAFGKGSLEILSYLQALNESDDNEYLEKMIKEYFSEIDQTKREVIRLEIIGFFNKSQKTQDE